MGAEKGPVGTRGMGAEPRPLPYKAAKVQTKQRRDQQPLGWMATIFIACISAAGVGLIGWYAPRFDSSDIWGLALLTILAVLADRLAISIYGETRLSVSFIPIFAVAVLYGPPGVAIAGPIAAVAVHIPRRLFSLQPPFDVGNVTIAITLAALTFEGMAGLARDEIRPVMLPAALTAAAVAYAVNAYLVSQWVSLTTGRPVLEVWLEKGRWIFPHYVVFGLLGLALALAYRALGVTGLLAFVAPPLMMQLSIKQYVERTTETVTALRRKNEELVTANREILAMTETLRETYDGTLEALVTALDARDRETKGHSTRVTEYTLDVAKRLGLKPGTSAWEDLKRAALLHDVGKIGVSDFILHKPGPLTSEEWEEMRRHPGIAYEMLKGVRFLAAPAEIVLSHHERFDGKGYPRALTGDEIPLGARIFAVADTFDAMTSDRPYRRALPWEAARDEIVRHKDTQFDSQVVEAFLQAYEEWVRREAREKAAAVERRRAA
jgi:HD-GYP domain-containing protein (c-di-GMP phosphodiesterase class II)